MRNRQALSTLVTVGIATAGLSVPFGTASAAPATGRLCDIVAQKFGYTGALQTFQVPAGVSKLDAMVSGASGGSGGTGSTVDTPGGNGAYLSVTGLPVTPQSVLNLVVGGAGGSTPEAGGGGGASYVYTTPTMSGLLIAAGGGGGGFYGKVGGDALTTYGGTQGGSADIGGGGSSFISDGQANYGGFPGGGQAATSGAAGGSNSDGGGTGGYGGGGGSGLGRRSASGALELGGGGGGGMGGGSGGGTHGTTAADPSGGGGSYSVVPATTSTTAGGGPGLIDLVWGRPQTITVVPNYTSAATTTFPLECGLAIGTLSPSPRTGYDFTGWTTDQAGTSPYDLTTPVQGPLTLYAQWTRSIEAVTFSENGGSAAPPPTQRVPYGSTVTRPGVQVRDGWVFDDWYTQPVGGTAWNFATPVTAPLALYAQWTEVSVSPPSPPAPHTVIRVRARAPLFRDRKGTRHDTYLLRATRGVVWLVDGRRTRPGIHHAKGLVIVKAQASKGYRLVGRKVWRHRFSES